MGQPNLARRKYAETGLYAFGDAYFQHYFTEPCGEFHKELCRNLELALRPLGRLVGAIPREHTKSSWGTVILAICAACRRLKCKPVGRKTVGPYIRIWSATEQEAKQKLENIRVEFESNQALKDDYGQDIEPMKEASGAPVRWNDLGLLLNNGVLIESRVFLTKARGMRYRNIRPSIDILDDPENDSDVENKKWRDRATNWVNTALLNGLDSETGSLIWLGTILHRDSVLMRVLKPARGEKADWIRMNRRAIEKDENGDPRALWPERWPLKKLQLKKMEIGSLAFAKEYLNDPVDPDAQRFKREWYRTFDLGKLEWKDGVWTLPDPFGAGRRALYTVLTCDPAIGEDRHHDYSAYGVIGAMWHPERATPLRFILHIERARIGPLGQIQRITSLYERWHPTRIGIEKYAAGQVFGPQALQSGLPVVPIGGDNASKHRRIDASAIPVENGWVYLPDGAAWVEDYLEEAESYPSGEHDDQLDVVAYAMDLTAGQRGDCFYSSPRRNTRTTNLRVVGW